jgi:hypothetical protein
VPIKIINPHWRDAATKKAEQHRAVVAAWMLANPNNRKISLAELKVALPAIAADINQPVFCEIARLEGWTLEDDE